jgi:hypothetical protein
VRTVITTNAAKVSAKYKKLLKKLDGVQARATDMLADEAIVLYKKTTRTWRHKPTFRKKKTARGVQIITDDPIYKFVDRGTRPHIIRAKNAPFLVFAGPYKAATKPRVIGSTNATVGDNWSRKLMVHHPGNAPRHFTDEITKRINKRAGTVVKKEINKVINAEGFGL